MILIGSKSTSYHHRVFILKITHIIKSVIFYSPSQSNILIVYRIILRYTYPFAAKSLQSCLTLCDPIDGGPPGSPVPGILQARTLEWVAISFSNA